MQDRQPNPSSRRGFFTGAATLGAAAAAVAVLPRAESEPAVVQESARPAPERGGGYHLSAHVRQYYKTTQL
ncbi:MAG: formate dehydrogenase [Acidovorax sp.]|nr:formate dehydrogenase [Acidovorax sp.]